MILRYFQLCFLGVLFLHTISGADESNSKQDQEAAYEAQRYDELDWNLLKELRGPEFGNVIISPLSVKMVLAMVYQGSSGVTKKELNRILNFSSDIEVRDRFKKIISSLTKPSSDYTLNLGSRIYMDSTIQPQQRYAATMKMFYDTDITSLNFTDATTSKNKINYWISNVTHGHIRDLVQESDIEDAIILLTNALFFKGLWKIPFPRNQTNSGSFYVTPRQTISTEFMYNYGQYYYMESNTLDAKILRLPFKGSQLSMFILLPNSKAGLSELINKVNPQILRRHVWLMDLTGVHVYLPKFAFNFNAKFGRILQLLGLNHIFQNTASLAGIARGKGLVKKLVVSNIIQKSGIDVNEEGSTAYAATEVTLVNKFGLPDVIFNATFPFMFYIEDEYEGTVLFSGKVENPEQREQPPFRQDLNVPSRFAPATPTQETNVTNAPVNGVISQNAQNFGSTNYPFPPEFLPGYQEDDLTGEEFFYFDIDLLEVLSNEEVYGNILVSPLSIKSTLAMILEGAAKESEAELKLALHLPENMGLVRDQFKKLLDQLDNQKRGVILKMANRIFLSHKLSPLKAYRDTIGQYYNSNVTKIDFSNPQSGAAAINHWVNKETNGVIPSLVDPGNFGAQTSILIANALYFKGIWEKAFSEQGTVVKCFHLLNGQCQHTPMMDVVDNFKYDEVKHLDAKVIEIPYSGGEYSMVIMLPNKRNGVHRLARDIRKSLSTIVDGLPEAEVYVTLPRFAIDYSTDIAKFLPRVHINTITGPNAVLTGIVADLSVRVSNIFHKTRIEVNEQGTIAAAATGAVVIPLMGNMKPRFRADHPFLFFIRHIPSGSIIFEGRVTIPERAPEPQPQLNRPKQPQSQYPFTGQNQQHSTQFASESSSSQFQPASFQNSQQNFQNHQLQPTTLSHQSSFNTQQQSQQPNYQQQQFEYQQNAQNKPQQSNPSQQTQVNSHKQTNTNQQQYPTGTQFSSEQQLAEVNKFIQNVQNIQALTNQFFTPPPLQPNRIGSNRPAEGRPNPQASSESKNNRQNSNPQIYQQTENEKIYFYDQYENKSQATHV